MTTQEDHECREEPVLSMVICSYCIQQIHTHTHMKSRPICVLSYEFNMVSWKKRKGKSQDCLAGSKTDSSWLLYTSMMARSHSTISQQTSIILISHISLAEGIYLSISYLIECLHVRASKVEMVLRWKDHTLHTIEPVLSARISVFPHRFDLLPKLRPTRFEREIRKRKDVMRVRESYSCLSVGVLKGFLLSTSISKYHLSCIHFKYQL